MKGAGFVPPDSEQEPEHDAQLPPELMGFTILKNMPGVAAALAKPSFRAAQKAVQDSPNDQNALAALQRRLWLFKPHTKTPSMPKSKSTTSESLAEESLRLAMKDFKGVNALLSTDGIDVNKATLVRVWIGHHCILRARMAMWML